MPSNGNNGNTGADESGQENAAADVTLSVDATFDILADSERRVLLEILMDASDNTVDIEKLVNQLVRWNTGQTGDLPSSDSVEMRLYHIHLPKLTEMGIVAYDARNGELRYYSDERLEEWLQRAQAEATD